MNRHHLRLLASALMLAMDKKRFREDGTPISPAESAREAVAYADALISELFDEGGNEQ